MNKESKNLLTQPGQINLNTNLGKIIYDLVSKNNFNTVVDIGTWNGLGTTYCVLKALEDSNNTNTKLITIELYKEMFEAAKINLANYLSNPNFKMLLGRIVEFEEVYWFYHKKETANFTDPHAQLWYYTDMKLLIESTNVLSEIPDKIDLLILDGGEYTTYLEWQILKDRVNLFVLDDTNILKCAKIKKEILSDNKYKILYDVTNERNGYLIGRRIDK